MSTSVMMTTSDAPMRAVVLSMDHISFILRLIEFGTQCARLRIVRVML
jgi:hypothetical protein